MLQHAMKVSLIFFSQPCDFATTIRKVALHHFELPGPVVFKLDVHLESPTDLVKTNYWAPRICISNKFQVTLALLAQRPVFKNHGLN